MREVLATALLEAFGVYTSKSFSLIETGEALMRGDEPSPTRSAVLVRLSHSHVRFGTFTGYGAKLLAAGLWPFALGTVVKTALAAALMPAAWAVVRRLRA